MSRAFVKGDESDQPGQALPERPLGEPPFYVTPRGLAQLRQRFDLLQAEHSRLRTQTDSLEAARLPEIERDLRYLAARLEGAVVVEPGSGGMDEVRFGAAVTTCDAAGHRARYVIVGDDEADAVHGRIGWRAPLARALLGARAGDVVTWERPAGNLQLEVVAIGLDGESTAPAGAPRTHRNSD